MADYRTNRDGTTIMGMPDDIANSPEKRKPFVQMARSIFGPGSTSDFSKVQQAMTSGSMGLAGIGEATQSTPLPSDTPSVEDITADQPTDVVGPLPSDTPPETTFKGMVDSFLREAGPNLVAGAGGFALGGPLGAAVGILGTEVTEMITPKITEMINKKFGTDQVSFGEVESMVSDALGLEEADTPAEQMAGAAGRGTAEALGVMASGQALAGAPATGYTGLAAKAPQIAPAPSTVQRVGQTLMAQPGQQLVGGALSGVGAEAGMQIAEEQDLGPVGSVIVPLGLGIAGDIVGSGIVNAADKVNRLMVARGMDLPEAAAEAIRLSQGRGELFLSDFEEAPSLRETMAWSPKERAARNARRRQVIYDAMDNMGITDQGYFNRDIIDDFNAKRGELLDQWTGEKNEVIERLSKGGLAVGEDIDPATAVPIPETLELIQNRAAELSALNDDSLRPLINTLANWEGSLGNKNLVQIEFLRKRLRNQFEDPSLASVKDDGGRLAKEVYDSLNKEMGEYIKTEGSVEDFNQWKTANTVLADMMGDFQVDALSTMIRKGKDNPDVVNQFLNSGSMEQLENLYNNLSKDGISTVQSAIMTDIMKKATDLGDLSPNQFARLLERSPATGVFFDVAKKSQLDGLQRWLEATKKAEAVPRAMDIGTQLPGERYAIGRGLWSDPRIGLPVALAGKMGGKKVAQWLERGDVRDLMIKYAAIPDKEVSELAEFGKRLGESYRAFMGSGAPERARSQKPLMED